MGKLFETAIKPIIHGIAKNQITNIKVNIKQKNPNPTDVWFQCLKAYNKVSKKPIEDMEVDLAGNISVVQANKLCSLEGRGTVLMEMGSRKEMKNDLDVLVLGEVCLNKGQLQKKFYQVKKDYEVFKAKQQQIMLLIITNGDENETRKSLKKIVKKNDLEDFFFDLMQSNVSLKCVWLPFFTNKAIALMVYIY